MSAKKASTHAGNGLGFGTVLFLIFLTLKLTDHIDWSWWWVSAPLWGPIAIIAAVFILTLVFCGVAMTVAWTIDKVLK